MKVLALGGAGDMGRMAVAILLDSPEVFTITIADINNQLVEKFVEMVDSEKLVSFQIDINDRDKLKELISSHDIVINTIGPFYKFEIPVLETVIDAKKPYIDICDDWKPTQDAFGLNEQAINAGIPVVIGLGASPGITNLLAVYACSKLDKIDELITAWGECLDTKEGKKPKYYVPRKKLKKKLDKSQRKANAAIVHWLYETLEEIPTCRNGEFINIESLLEAELFEFPGYKPMYACHIGHPEPITLPRTVKAKNVSNVMYVGETMTEILRDYRKKVLQEDLSIESASLALEQDIKKLTRQAKMGKSPLKEYLGGPPTLSVIAIGTQKGKKMKVGVALGRNPHDEMAGVTGVPLAIGALMLMEGKIKSNGVLTPEEVFEPLEFFEKLAPYCGRKHAEDILVIREEEI